MNLKKLVHVNIAIQVVQHAMDLLLITVFRVQVITNFYIIINVLNPVQMDLVILIYILNLFFLSNYFNLNFKDQNSVNSC